MNKEKRIKIKMLNIAFINKKFIDDKNNKDDQYNYEKYLLELINHSKLVKDYDNQRFHHIKNQSNGECDITNKLYDMDFKLLIPQDTVEKLSNYSSQIVKLTDGVISYCDSKQHGKYTIYNYLGLLNHKTKENIINIKNKKYNCTKEEIIIKKLLKNIETDKNVLYFIPIEIIIDENTNYNKQVCNAIENFSNYIEGIIEYRNSCVKKDTYISFIANEYFIMAKYQLNKFNFYDQVKTKNSKLFTEIKDITTIWE